MDYATLAFAMATPIRERAGRLFLRTAMWLARQNRNYSPLELIGTIHVAGFSFVKRLRDRFGIPHALDHEFLLFVSVFDGSAALYLSDFGRVVPDQIDTIWDKCLGYPTARDGKPFSAWVDGHQFTQPNDQVLSYSYYGYRTGASGTLGSGTNLAFVPQVRNAIDLRQRLQRLRTMMKGGDHDRVRAAMLELIAEAPIGIEDR